MEKKWLKYLSESGNTELVPIMEKYFNEEIDLMELNDEIYNIGLATLDVFKKDIEIDKLFKDL